MATKGNREEILQITLQHILKEAPFKMSDLAEELQLSRKTLYNYFSSRNILIKETTKYFFEQIAIKIKGTIESDSPYIERGTELIQSLQSTVMQMESLAKKKVIKSDMIDMLSVNTYKNLKMIAEDYITEGQKLNIIKKDVKTERVADLFFLLLKGDFYYGVNCDADRFLDYSRMIFFGVIEESYQFQM